MLCLIELGKCAGDHIPILELDRICERLEKASPYNLEAFLGTGRTPGRFDTPDDVPQPTECLPPALPPDLDVIRLGVGGTRLCPKPAS